MNIYMVELRLKERLGNRSLYWLAKQTGVAYSTIHKLATTATQGISFGVLDRLCNALDCAPGDLLIKVQETSKNTAKRVNTVNRTKRRAIASGVSGKGVRA
jgi:putative transcriptional regulator